MTQICGCTPQNTFTGWRCPACWQAMEDRQAHIAATMRACPMDLCRLTSDGPTEDMTGCQVDSRAECPV